MAKITEEILKMLNINENTIGDYSGYEKKGEEYVLKLNDGSSRTYSERDFKNVFALSKIENDTGQKKTGELNFIDNKGRDKIYNLVEHKNGAGKVEGYSSDFEGKRVIPKVYVDFLQGKINETKDFITAMKEDSVQEKAYRNKLIDAGILFREDGKEKVSFKAGKEVEKYLQLIRDVGFLPPELAEEAKKQVGYRKEAEEKAVASMKKINHELSQSTNRTEEEEEILKNIKSKLRNTFKNKTIDKQYQRDIEKIDKAIKSDATIADMRKKIEHAVSKKASVNNLLSQLQYTVADTQASAIKALEGTPMHRYATKGIWKIGQVQGSGPIKSVQSTINATDARRVEAAFSKKNQIKTTATQYNTNGYKYSAVSNLENAKKIINSGKGLYYDFETTGQRGSDNFGALQFSARWTDDKGIDQSVEYLSQMSDAQTKYIDGLIGRIKDSKFDQTQMSEDEIRDLLSMTNYTEKDGQVRAKHIEYSKNVDLRNKELQKKIQEGRDLLSGKNGMMNLTKYEEFGKKVSTFLEGHEKAGRTITGQNIDTFDTPELRDAYNYNIKNTFDTLKFAQQYFKIGHKNAQGKMLLAYNLGALADHFGVDMTALEKSGLTQHTGSYDTAMTKAVLEKMIPEAEKEYKAMQGETVNAGDFGYVKTSLFRRDDDKFSHRRNASGDVIQQDGWGDWLLGKQKAYSFDGVVTEDIDKVTRSFAKFTNIANGESTYLHLRQGETVDDILSNTFDRMMKKGTNDKDDSILKAHANKNAILSAFDSRFGWKNLDSLNKDNLTENQRKVLEQIQNGIKSQADGLSDSARSLMMDKIGKAIGVSTGKTFSPGDFYRSLLGAGGKTQGQTKTILKKFVKDHKGEFKKGFVKDFYNTIDNLGFTEDQFNHRDGQSAIYGLTKLMYENLNDSYFADKINSSMIGDFDKVASNSSELDSIIKSTVEDFNSRYGKDALDDMYKNGSQGLKDMLSGEDTLKRLKLAGFNMDKEYSDLYKHLGQKNGKFGKNSIGQILKETIEGKAGTYGQAPIKGLSQQGVGTAILMNPLGTGFRVGFFDNSRVSEFQDADGAPLWHKMAGYIDVGTQDDGSILINGMPTANHLLPMYNTTDGTTIATLREGMFKNMMKGVLSEKNIERIKSGESIMSSLRWWAEEFSERGAGATYKTTEAEGKDFVKAGGTAEQMLTRAYSMDMRKYLIDAARGAGYTEKDIGHGYDRDNFVSALMDYFTNISLGTESNLENSTQFYLNGVEGLVGGKRKKLSNLKSAISGLAKAKRIDLGSLKEGAYGTERMSYIGSRDFNPFAILQSEQSRATDQFNNYVGRRRSAEDRKKAYNNGVTLKNYFSTQKGIDLLGADYFNQDIYDQFIMGKTTDADIAKFYEALEYGKLDQKLMDFFGGDTKRADAVKQGFLNNPAMSVYEGSLIVSQSVADELEKEAYRQEVKPLSERDLQKILPEAVKELKESGKNVYNFKDGELKKNKKLSSSIGLKEGDKIRAIERTAKGYQIVYDRKQHYGLGSKGVSQFGNRSTANRILSDDQFSFYADYSGNKGAGMIQKPEIKSSALAEIVGGRLSYLVNSHIQEKGDQGIQDVLNALNSKELKNTALSKFLRYDSKSKSFQQNAIYTNEGFKYYDDKGNLQSLFPTDADVEAFFNEDYNKDNKEGRKGDLAVFGEMIKGKPGYNETRNLIASGYALSNLYDVKEAVGTDLSPSDLKTLSKFNYGFREKAAVKTSIAAAELSHKNLSFDNLKGYFDTYLDNGDVNALNQELIYNRAFDDNISLIDTHEKNRELDINNRLNSNGESVSSDEILEIVNGEATGKNQVSLSDIFTTDESNYTGVMSKKEFQNTSHGRILQELEKRGMDPKKARVIFRTGHDIEVPNEYGKGGNMISSDFALGITPMLTNERGEVIYGETQRNLNAFLGSVYNYNSASTDSKYRDKNLQRTATDYLTSMFAARNKESQLFEELNRTYVGSSMTGKTVATNLALGEKFDNAMMVGVEDFTKMFTSHADTGTDTFANHINDLLSYYELSFGKSYKKTFDDFNKLTDSKGRKKFEQDIIKDMIKKIDISNKNAQSVFGVGHRYPSTNAQTMMFQRLMVDRSLSANRMRVGLGSGTGMNADFDGDTIGISVPLLQGISKNKDSKDLFKQMEELTKMEDYGKSLLGDWTRANAGLTYKDGKWISEESGDSGAKIEKLAKMRANPQSDAIAGWLSKKNFGSIGQLSIFATKFRNATRDAEMETTPESFLLASAGRALFELTEQGAISSKKVGDRLMKINQGDSEEETIENIIHGVERFRDKIMDYGRRGQYKGHEGAREKAKDVAKLGREIGLFGDDEEFMSGRQTADFVANMMKIANSDGVDPKVRDLIMNKETGLLAKWGVREISTNDKTKGQGGFMSYKGFINMYTDLIEHFGGNAEMLNAINSATFGTQGRTSANIAKTIEKSLVDANKTPTNFDTTDTSGDGTDVQNPDFSIGTLTVGTINAGSIISGSGAGTAITNSGNGGSSGGIGTISGSGVSNSSTYYPDEPLVLEKGMSVHKHLNFAKGLLAEAQKSLITEKDVENAQVTPLQLNGKKGQHSYSAGGKKIQNAFTFSQLGNLIDATKHGPIDSNQAKLQQQILELFHNGKINFKMTGSEMGKDYTSLQDIINELGNPSDASKLWAMSKVIGTTERGTMVHALMQYGSNRLFKQLKEAKTPEERANILRNGGNKNLRESVAAYENGMRNIGQLGPNSLEDVISKGISFYDMRERLPLPKEGLKEGAREKSYKVTYGTGKNAFSVIGTIDEMIRGLGALDWKTEKNIHEKSLNHMLQLMMAQRVFRQVYGDANLGDKALNSIMGSFTGGSFDVAKYDFSQVSNAKEANAINILRAQQLLMDGYAFGDIKVDDFVYKKKMNMFHDSSVKSANDLYSMLYQVTGFKDVDEVMEAGEKKGFSISKKNEDNDHTRFYFSKYDTDSGQMFDAEAVIDGNGVITEISKISESFKGNDFIKFKTEYDALRAKIEQINKSLESEDLTSAQRRELEEKRVLATKQKYDIYNSQSAAFKKAFETEDRMASMYDIIGSQTPFVDKNTGDEHSGNEIWGAMQDLISASSALQTAREFWHNANKSGDVVRQREAQKELDRAQGRYNEMMESFRGFASFGGFSKEQQEAISQYLNAFDASHMTKMFGIDDTATLRDSKDLMDQYVKIQDENNRLKIQENNYMEAANKALRKDDKDLNLSKAAQIRSIIDSKNQELSYNASTGTFSYLENGKQKTVQIADPVKKAEFDQRLISQQQTHQMEFQKQQIAHQNTGLFGKIKGGIRNALDYMVGYSLGYSIIGMVKQAFTMTIQNVMQLNKTMTDLAIVTGKNVSEMKELVGEYNNLAKEIGLTNAEVNASANEWLRMGYKESEINTLIKNTAMLSKLGMIEMGEATQYMTSAIKGYGVAVQDSMQIVDMATSLDMKYAVSAGYILEAMSRTATSAKLAKVEMSDLQAMIAVIGETSQKDASVIGESLKTAFARYGNVKAGAFLGNSDLTSLEDQYEYETFSQENADSLDDAAVNDIEKVLDKMDIDIRNGSEWRSYSDILEEVGKNFKNLSDYEKNAITTAMFGTRQRENGLIVLENYNKVLEAEKIATEAAGSSIIKYEKYLESVEAAKAKVTTAYEGLILDLEGAEIIKDALNGIAFALEHIGAILGTIGVSTLLLNLPKVLLGFNKLSTLPMFFGNFRDRIANRFSYDGWTNTFNQGYQNLISSGKIGHYERINNEYFRRHGYTDKDIKEDKPWKDMATKGKINDVADDEKISSIIKDKVDKNPILSKIKNKSDKIQSEGYNQKNKQQNKLNSIDPNDRFVGELQKLTDIYEKKTQKKYNKQLNKINKKYEKIADLYPDFSENIKQEEINKLNERYQKKTLNKANKWYNRQLEKINQRHNQELDDTKITQFKKEEKHKKTEAEKYRNQLLRRVDKKYKSSSSNSEMLIRKQNEIAYIENKNIDELLKEKEIESKNIKKTKEKIKQEKIDKKSLSKEDRYYNKQFDKITKRYEKRLETGMDNAVADQKYVDELSGLDKKIQRMKKIKEPQKNGLLSSIRSGLTPEDRFLNNYRKTMSQADYARAVGINIEELAKKRAGGEGASQAQIDEEMRALNKMDNSQLFNAYNEAGMLDLNKMSDVQAKETLLNRYNRAMKTINSMDYVKEAERILGKNEGKFKFKGQEYTNAEDLSKALGENARQNAAKIQSQENLNAESKKILEGYKNKTPQDIEADRLKANYKNKTGQSMSDATAQRLAAKNLTVASGIDAASSMLGLMVGAQAGSAMGQAFAEFIGGDEETWGMVGSAIGMGLLPFLMNNISTSVGEKFGAVAGSLAGAGIGLAVAAGVALFNKHKKEVEKAEKAQAERVEKSQEKIEKYSSLDTQTKFERYDELAKGVNQYGDNISLTDTEYDEFQTLGDELGNQFDNLIIGTDRFGHSLLGANDELGGLADASKELLEIEKQKLYKEKLSDPEKGDSLFQKAFEKYSEKKEDLNSDFWGGSDSETAEIIRKNFEENKKDGKFQEGTKLFAGDEKVINLFSGGLSAKKNKELTAEIEDILNEYENINYEGDKKKEIEASYTASGGIEFDFNGGNIPEEKKKELAQKISNAIFKAYDKNIRDYEKELQAAQLEFTKEFLPAILNTNPIWEQLDDITQSFVSQVASGIDLAANDIKSADDYKTLIEDKVLSPINKLTEEKLLKFEQRIAAFADKEHLGIELTLSESSDQYSVNTDLVKTAYKNADDGTKSQGVYGYFGTIAKQMGYTHGKEEIDGKERTVWTSKDKKTKYVYENGQWVSTTDPKDVMDDDIYAKIIGTNKAEDILDEILLKKYGKGHEEEGTVLKEGLTLEEAQWVAKKSDTWLERKSENEIIEAAQTEALTSTGTMKSRIQDAVKESSEMTLSDFEDLIESAKTVDDVIKGFNSEPLPDGLEKQLNLLKDRADLLGISLAEAYNQAKALSSIDKFGMTTKSVQSIVTESENMMNIAMAVNQGSISGELITYLQDHAPELFAYTGTELSAEIMKSLGTSALIGASLKGTMSNSNAYFDAIYGELKSATGDAKITPSKEFEDFVKNNTDMLKYQDYFKEALTTDGSSYTTEGIALAVSESDEVKEWLENHGVSTSEKGWEEKVSNVGSDILSVGPKVEAEMKKSIADMIVKIDTHNVQQTHRAFKELTKNIRDLNEQLKDLEKQNAINKLNNELERLTINIDGLDKKINLFDWASGFLAEGDFEGKSKALEDNLSALADKNKDLSAAMAEVESKTPKSAEEAEALKQKYDELSSSYIENQKAILEVQKQMESLGVTMLSSAVTESFESLNKQMQATSDYAKISNLETYTGGAEGLLNYNLAGTIESKSEIDKKRSQYDTLLKMREDFNNQLLKYDKQYLDMKEKQDAEDYNKQKTETAESIRDARVEFFQEYGHILQERYGKDKAMEMVGISQKDIDDYWSSSLGIDPKTIQEATRDADKIFDQDTPKGDEEPSDKTPKGDKEPKAKTPTIEGTDAKVDTPESVSTHITKTMKAGIEAANAEMIENSKDYGIKATPFDSESWGVDLESGLGLDIKKAYETIIKNLNEYIETTNTEGTKLASPQLDWKGSRGWGVDNTSSDSLISRMKKRIKLCVEALNTYISTDSGVGKLSAPKIDQETWETFGITIGKYIYTGIEFALQEGIEKDLDVLFDEYKESRKNNTGNDRGSGHLTSKAGNSSPFGLGMSRLGGSPIASNGIPVGATVYMESPTSPQYGHVGIMGSDGKVWHWSGSKVLNQSLDHLSSRGFIPYSWGWHGGTPLSYTEAMALDSLLQQRKGQNCGKSQCQKWVGLTYSDALNTSYISSGGSAKIAGSKWGVNSLNGDLSSLKDYSSNPFFAFSHASGTDSHKGGLALIGDEGLVNNKSGLFPELVILPNGEIALMGTHGPVLANLPKGTEVLNNTDTNEFIGVDSYADGTGENNYSLMDETLVSKYKAKFESMLDAILGVKETTWQTLEDRYLRISYKRPVTEEYQKLENQAADPTTRASYKMIRNLYATDSDVQDYKKLSLDASKKYKEALSQMEEAILRGESLEIIEAWSKIVDDTKAQLENAEESIQAALDSAMQAYSTFAEKVAEIFNNTKENLDLDYENGILGEKTNRNYYNPLREAGEKQINDLQKAYNGALQTAINRFLELGHSAEVAYSKAMENETVIKLGKDVKNAYSARKQIEIDYNNDIIDEYERANTKIEEQLGYNDNLSNEQFRDVYSDTQRNYRRMIKENKRFLEETENLSPEEQKAAIDKINADTKALITTTSDYINNVLNNSKKLVDASINERDKKLAVGGINAGTHIFTSNISDYEDEADAIAQAIADTRYNLEQEARYNGLTNEDDIEEYINNHSDMISLNEQWLDSLKKVADEHKKIRDYTLEQIENERKLLDLSKEEEWASKANIQNYYDAVDQSLDAQIAAQKKYLESKNLSEEEYQQTKMAIAELEREKHNNALKMMQDTQAFYNKEYNAMTYMVNEYITALSEEKESISETYDEEIDKLQKVNDAKERKIKLTELENNLEKAQNEKKRVYRAGVGFVYEQDREAVKKAKDELDDFYRQDQIDSLNKAKEMETKILDERIEKWNKYLDAIEKVYKTAERNHNIGILENLLGTEGWQGVFNELNSDMSNFIKEYDAGMKIYHGSWTSFLDEYRILSEQIYQKLEDSVTLLENIKNFSLSDVNVPDMDTTINGNNTDYMDDDINKTQEKNQTKYWRDYSAYVRDFSKLYAEDGTASSLVKELKDKYGIVITQAEAKYMHEQKENELLSFTRGKSFNPITGKTGEAKGSWNRIEDILSYKIENDTDYSREELYDALVYSLNNQNSLGEITTEEIENKLERIALAEEERLLAEKRAAEKDKFVQSLINGNVDIASIIKPIADGSSINLNGFDFTKEELEKIRAEKIYKNYKSGKYGDINDSKTIEYISGLVDDVDGDEDKNDVGKFGTGLLGKFWDSLLEHTFGETKVEELSQSIQALVEGQSKALDETNTTLFEVSKLGEGKVEYETTNAGGTQSSPNFNLYNYYIAKESNKLGQVMDASAQVKDITNKK